MKYRVVQVKHFADTISYRLEVKDSWWNLLWEHVVEFDDKQSALNALTYHVDRARFNRHEPEESVICEEKV
jgi:hypothetical protein